MGAEENGIPQRHRITGFAAVAVSLRAGKRTKMNCAHMAILQRSDTLQLSESGRGRVSFQNERKHIVISFRTDHNGLQKQGVRGRKAGNRRTDRHGARPHTGIPPAGRTTPQNTDARRHKKKPTEVVPPRALRGGGYLLSHPC